MALLFVNGLLRRGKRGVGKRARGDRNLPGFACGQPVNRAAAVGAKMKLEIEAVVGAAREAAGFALDLDRFGREKRGYAEGAAGTPLTIAAVAQ